MREDGKYVPAPLRDHPHKNQVFWYREADDSMVSSDDKPFALPFGQRAYSHSDYELLASKPPAVDDGHLTGGPLPQCLGSVDQEDGSEIPVFSPDDSKQGGGEMSNDDDHQGNHVPGDIGIIASESAASGTGEDIKCPTSPNQPGLGGTQLLASAHGNDTQGDASAKTSSPDELGDASAKAGASNPDEFGDASAKADASTTDELGDASAKADASTTDELGDASNSDQASASTIQLAQDEQVSQESSINLPQGQGSQGGVNVQLAQDPVSQESITTPNKCKDGDTSRQKLGRDEHSESDDTGACYPIVNYGRRRKFVQLRLFSESTKRKSKKARKRSKKK